MAMLVRGGQDIRVILPPTPERAILMAGGLLRGLQAHLFPQGADMVTAQQKALGALYRSVQQQAALLAYADNFRLIASLAFACIPLVLLLKKIKRHN